MSTNKIDDMTEVEAKSLLNDICCELGIGCKARNRSVIMTCVSNAIRRSSCLGKIEALYTRTVLDEHEEETEEQLLNWGESPDKYIETFKKVVGR